MAQGVVYSRLLPDIRDHKSVLLARCDVEYRTIFFNLCRTLMAVTVNACLNYFRDILAMVLK